MYCICHQMYCRDSHIQYIRSPTWVYCISYHVNQESHLVYCICQLTGVLHIYAIMYMYIRSLAWVYCICQQVHWIYHQVYCRGHHAHQEPHLVYCICHQVYCIYHHLTSGATLLCTTLAIKCSAEAMLYFRSLTWVYCT